MHPTAAFEKKYLRTDLPEINPGDTVKIFQKIREGDKERIQPFEGIVIARKHGRGLTATVTVRKVSEGIGVERIFPIHSPTIQKIDVLKRAHVRRAKLYYIREKAAKETRRKMKSELAITVETTAQ
ncbi:MAG: 50S ribosomal protein L19 [Candidatus Sungbacteria bacterium]|uniref:Large ribosomal subunit protein bL19 n=1 Tax=Candidatus Sungiibacteriota bacterium TaxID=2750080 RepID=A0A932YXA7_9BACT|nr:50S ribosomal protein L19 [Candidatus Sungbacteria bacterium]